MTAPVVPLYPSFATPEQYALLTSTAVDPNIQPLLDGASGLIRRYCQWHISPVVTADVVVDGRGGYLQTLPTLRLVDLVSLDEIDCNATIVHYDGSELEWSASGYVKKQTGQWARGTWTERLRGITASMTHGFDPAEVLDLSILCAHIVASAVASPFGEKMQGVGSVNIQYSTTSEGTAGGMVLAEHQMLQLDRYRLFGRA